MSTQKKVKSDIPLTSIIFESFSEHPFITLAILCFFSISVTTGENISLVMATIPALMIFAALYSGINYLVYDMQQKSKKSFKIILTAASLIFSALFAFILHEAQKPELFIMNIGMFAMICVATYLISTKKLSYKNIILILFFMGFLIRLAYIMSIPVTQKQHDVGSVEELKGHIGYIAYLYYNSSLPDVDVRTVYQYYHPPLHHIFAAIWLKIQTMIGVKFEDACENIQILTLFYSCCCMILSYKIFKALKLEGKGLVIAFAVIVFCPTFYIMSGSINNDILSVTFILGAVLNTLYWYKSRTLKRILCIAACVGCGMMAKLSAWMAAPAIGFVFIYVLYKELKKTKFKNFKPALKYIKQYAIFLVLCVPLAFWWGIRNLVGWGVPITYVLKLSETSKQYIGDVPLMKRLFDFNLSQFKNVGECFVFYNCDYNEYNPLIGLFKTSMFDELFTVQNYPAIEGVNKILFWSAVILGIIGFAAMIYTLINPSEELDFPHKVFVSLFYFVIFISYYIFCINFPHVCTMNIRYAVPLIVVGAYFVGIAVNKLLSKDILWKKISGYTICVICGIYSLFSYACYTIIFM